MANKPGRRRFGSVRQLPSGRWQVRYQGPDGLTRTAPLTFESEKKASKWLTLEEAAVIRGEWVAPEAGGITLDEYAPRWIAERKLSSRTRENYEDLYRLHTAPYLGKVALGAIRPATIRSWRKQLLDDGHPEPQAVKAYCVLRAVLNTAMKEDGIIRDNPCRIRGYDRYHTPERPTVDIVKVYELADAMPKRFRALVLLAALSGLRWGELIALRRSDLDLKTGTVRVQRKLATLRSGKTEFGPPKTDSGVRTVALPASAVAALQQHFDGGFVQDGVEGLVFTGAKNALLRSGSWASAVSWRKTLDRLGFPEKFHFHDLRHTGNTLASTTGASTRELMHRMGHASMRAALIYQHATRERDQEIAREIERRITQAKGTQKSELQPPEGESEGSAGG
ncbi:putative prophage phiRv2 integrase [Pilimelia terevasa]|uniref:Putative prophage phiRv2 integrase n=1 Tax=Pilimelia terevasa TaxID=53372 RepID=A0A8J3BPR2_9ACTN|nr:site-specific integrase [Pilimelia terevasa]GGK38120.1 putative prophage phiRv2 integrase [Pilimelia terevasa]